MINKLKQDVLTEAYKDVQEMVRGAVLTFWRAYGGELEELMGEANLLFIEAYHRYKENRGDFDKWVKYFVFIQLLERLRRDLYRKARCKRINKEDTKYLASPVRTFSLLEFIEELPNDIARVVKMVFSTPVDIKLTIEGKGGYTPTRFRSALREHLKDLGWNKDRITIVFDQIRKALE